MSKNWLITITLFIFLTLLTFFSLKPYYDFLTKDLNISLLKILFSANSIKKVNNQVNILVLGIAGESYEGPNLTDSIMVVNYNFKTNHIITISIPRDIWSDTLKDRINSAYAYGEAQKLGNGLNLAKTEISKIIGNSIQYGLVIDFEQFKELIDYLKGIDVYIDRSFTDKQFPIPGKENDLCGGDPAFSCRYQSISFNKGMNHMDGASALKFVRSRHALGIEGSDFARTQRQQKVIEAIKNRIIQMAKKSDINDIKNLYSNINKLVIRDFSNQQFLQIIKNVLFKGNFSQKGVVLLEELFTIPSVSSYGGRYVLIPNQQGFDQIHALIACYLEEKVELDCLNLINK